MDQNRFDALTQHAGALLPRRSAVSFTLAAMVTALGLGHAGAKKGKGKTPKPNEFGCLDGGKPCRGNDDACCSGICKGKKPKPGQKDRSKCVPHNKGICTPARDFCRADFLDTLCALPNPQANCFTTTGKAGFCADIEGFQEGLNCRLCKTDKDCEDFGFVRGSACVVLRGKNCKVGNDDACAETDNRACLPPADLGSRSGRASAQRLTPALRREAIESMRDHPLFRNPSS